MGCQCCRMIKSYIYDPSVAVDERKTDSAGSSLYQPNNRMLGRDPQGSSSSRHNHQQKQGFHNLGYSKSADSTLKLEVDNNHVNNSLHATPSSTKELQRPTEVYIIHPEGLPRWVIQDKGPSHVPVYPDIQEYEKQRSYNDKGHYGPRDGWDSGITECEIGSVEGLSVDEGVAGMPEYPFDTGDEGSALSVDVHTSNTSLSSADTKDELRLQKTPDESGISVMKSEDEGEETRDEKHQEEEVQSVTDSMVAEALAALEAATAGEDFE